MRESEVSEDRVPDPEGVLLSLGLASALEHIYEGSGTGPDRSSVLELIRTGIDRSSRSVSSRGSGMTLSFSHLGRPWLELALVVADPGEPVEVGPVALRLSGNSSTDPESRFVIALGSSGSWRLDDSSFGCETSRVAALRDVTGFSFDGEAWQVRAYLLDSDR